MSPLPPWVDDDKLYISKLVGEVYDLCREKHLVLLPRLRQAESELKRLRDKLAKAAEEIRKHNADYHYVTPAEVQAELQA
jgi:hypothetical protein